MDWLYFLSRANDVLTAGVGATALALALYLLFYNRGSKVAQTFVGLLGCVIVVYLMDILLTNVAGPAYAEGLLRLQWIGIAFTPPLYLEFVRAIRYSVLRDHFPAWLRPVSLGLSAVVMVLALSTDLVVRSRVVTVGALHLRPGPLFFPFALVFAIVALWGLRETLSARQRCYTRTARRHMAYLSIGFVAPAMGVFPYLLLTGWSPSLPSSVLQVFLIVGNVAVGAMLALMAYSVAFFGTLMPDRVIKHRLVRFLMRGPLTAILALIAFGLGRTLEPALGLGDYTLSLVVLAVAIILAQLGVELLKPLIDLLLYRSGAVEVTQVQELSQRLLTTADLRQFLENVLAAICELMRSAGGFLAILEEGRLHWEIWCDRPLSEDQIADIPLTEVTQNRSNDGFIHWNGHWIIPIRDKVGSDLLGFVGLRTPEVQLPLEREQTERLDQLLLQASAALADRRLQQVVFEAFTPLLPELRDIQMRGGMLRYDGDSVVGFPLVQSPELPQWVHDALAHYWGGPRLTENPLLELEVVRQASLDYDGNVVKGLRAVLTNAIERLRPDGERKLTAPEWLLYNILEMKFLRGQKVRQVAMRLAVSESDLYRKQRVAIENLAAILVDMEKEAHGSSP
ncbi:MAG: histidine kinase N-terminal 7TM domain-containing protein [Anaerolineae bacterium]